MRLRVYHRTHYTYRAPVRSSHNEVRLRPATTDERRLEFFLLNVQPPSRLKHFRDEHLNCVHWFEVAEPHRELVVEATSILNTNTQYIGGRPTGIQFPQLAGRSDDGMRPFLGDSQYIALDPEVWRLAVDARDGCTDVFETAELMMGHIHRNWRYDATATDVSTHMRETMRSRAGVCQDFTHVMIGMCRALGIPARYVSGYVFNGTGGALRGAQASHAWCEIHLPELGWYGLDPTNNCLADERHVKIATGRDYADAAPLRGRLCGPENATASMAVTVEVEEA